MEFVLENFLDNLDERWSFLIYHGTENEQWLNEIIKSLRIMNWKLFKIKIISYIKFVVHLVIVFSLNNFFLAFFLFSDYHPDKINLKFPSYTN